MFHGKENIGKGHDLLKGPKKKPEEPNHFPYGVVHQKRTKDIFENINRYHSF